MYKDWRGIVYPERLPQRRWFEHYATLFDTVEINNTFYRLPPPATTEGWAAQAPPGFTYALKLGQFGSHRMKLRDAATWLPNHLDRVERLGGSLGPNLVQLPPRWKRNPERLDEFLTVAPKAIRWAVEVREASWLHEDVYEVLRRHGAALCIHDLLADHPWELTTDWTYVRFHGPDALNQKYLGLYGAGGLEGAASTLAAWSEAGHDVYAYFNNDWYGHAVTDAAWLAERLGRRPPRSGPGDAGVDPAHDAAEEAEMPKKDLPGTIERSPAKAQRTFAKTLESAEETYGEGERASRTALAALKHSFEKVGDHWEPKDEKGPSDPGAAQPGPGGEHAGGVDVVGHTKAELYERAARLGVKGRSRMTKLELGQAIARKQD